MTALASRMLAELGLFTDWLTANGADGYVGEVAWPADDEWDEAASDWCTAATAAGLWVSYWSSGSSWPVIDRLAAYIATNRATLVLDTPQPQAAVVEAHGIGVNVSGAEFALSAPFSNGAPGNYRYEPAASFAYLAGRGITQIRLPFRWERVQPTIAGALDAAEVASITAVLDACATAGIGVILDVHNGASYYVGDGSTRTRHDIGSATLPRSAFADLWGRLSTEFAGHAALLGYGLMNEPTTRITAAQWEADAQSAVDVIRANDTTTTILVPFRGSYIGSGVTDHPTAWVVDSGPHRYEAHHYLDLEHFGWYPYTPAGEGWWSVQAGYA